MAKAVIDKKQYEELREKMSNSQLRKIRVVTGKLVSRFNRYDVGAPQSIVLLDLLFCEDCEPAQIAERTLIPRQTMTSILDKLEKSGLVERENHPSDRRRKVIVLTQTGYDKALAIWNDLDSYEESVMSILTLEEQKTLNAINAKIGKRLQELG